MPVDVVTKERLESVLLGIATQIASGMAEVKADVTLVITEAELRWQAKLAGEARSSSRDWAQVDPLPTSLACARSLRSARQLSTTNYAPNMPSSSSFSRR